MGLLNIQMFRGLQTALDDAEASPGSLASAVNAEYVRRRRAIRPARGRAYLGNQTAGSGRGSHSNAPVDKLIGLTWDPLTTVDGSLPELYQLLYQAGNAGEPYNGVRTLALGTTAGDAGMDAAASRLWDGRRLFGETLDAAAFENKFYIAGLGVLERDETGQSLKVHGCVGWSEPFEDGYVPVLYGLSNTDFGLSLSANSTKVGSYWVWCTWENQANEREGPAEADDAVAHHVGTTTTERQIIMFRRDIEQKLPYADCRIKVYHSLRLEKLPVAYPESAAKNPWPYGWNYWTINPTVTPWEYTLRPGAVEYGPYQMSTHTYNGAEYYYIDPLFISSFSDENANQEISTCTVFPFVTTRFGNDTANAAKNGTPPAATAYEVFDESLIANDKADPRKTWFSYPGDPHAFPGTFYINHETKLGDQVVGYATVRNVLGVFLRYGVERILWLPRESEVDYSRKRFRETISSERGAVAVDAIAKFLHPHLGEMIAFVSDDGVWATNIVQQGLLELTGRIEWEEHVTHIGACKLVDDPENKRLLLAHGIPGGRFEVWGPPTGLTALHYGEEYLDEQGRMAIIGPVERVNGIVAMRAVVLPNGRRQVLTADGLGSIFFEGVGNVDQSTLDDAGNTATALPMLMTSKQIYPGGLLREVELGMMGVRSTGPSDLRIELRTYGALGSRTFDLSSVEDPVTVANGNIVANRFEVEVTGTGDAEFNMVELEVLDTVELVER